MGAGYMKIYLDIFFAVNFLMNLLILEIMNIFLKKRLVINMRSIAAAALGAFFAGIVVVSGSRDRFVIFIIMYVLVSGLMMRLAYGKTTVGGLAGYIAGYYVSGIFTAGVLLFLKGITGIKNISIIFLLLSAILILFLMKKMLLIRGREMSSRQNVYPVKISYNGKSVTGTGFLDTGNQLYEPVSREGVTIVEYKLFAKMLSDKEQAEFSRAMHEMEPEMFGRLLLRYIPFHSIGKEHDFLPGVRVDDMEIQIRGKETVHTGKVWLGIYDRYLSADGRYEILLNGGIFRK